MKESIEQVVANYTAAEQALKAIAAQTEELGAASARVDLAWSSLESAGETLDQSRGKLEELARALHDSSAAMASMSHEMAAAATALTEIEPERLVSVGEETQAEVHKLGTRLQQLVEARTSAVTDAIVASIGVVRTDLASEMKELTSRQDQSRLSLETLEASTDRVVQRQSIVIALSGLAGLLAAIACAIALLR